MIHGHRAVADHNTAERNDSVARRANPRSDRGSDVDAPMAAVATGREEGANDLTGDRATRVRCTTEGANEAARSAAARNGITVLHRRHRTSNLPHGRAGVKTHVGDPTSAWASRSAATVARRTAPV